MTQGVLLVGHGSRERAGNERFLALSSRLKGRVQPCFLGHASPTIAEAVGALPVSDIAVVPVFLFEAGHLKRDLPAALAKAGRPGLTFRVGAPLGLDPAVVRMAASRIHPEETVLLVGRGASDPGARAGLCEVGRLLQAETGCAGVVPAFCDVASPGLEEGLAACLAGGARQVAVLPYLLFPGVLMGRIAALVASWQMQGLPVRLAGEGGLGCNPGMVDILQARIGRMG